jgi:regulator of protease activity HflC (stomatin/prohibitin superfamily)
MDGNFLIQSLEWVQTKWNDYISPIILVRHYEGGILLSMGKFQRVLKKGINWKLPYPFNEAHKCLVKPETLSVDVTITTSDNITRSVEVIGEYEVEDVRKWILEANDAFSNVRDLLKGYSEDVLSDSSSEEINKKPIKTKIKGKLNEGVSSLGAKFNRILFGKNVITRSLSVSGISLSKGSEALML